MSLQGWHELKCPKCESRHFIAVFQVIWQNGMGTSTRPVGQMCVECHDIVDQAKMVAFAKKLDAERQIKDLEAQLG